MQREPTVGCRSVRDTSASDAPRSITAVCIAVAGCAIFLFAWYSLTQPLWLDELLTVSLLQADSLPKLWTGIAAGVDGNPPLYLTLAWLGTHLLPAAWQIPALKLAGVAVTIAATCVLYRVSIRVASSLASWGGVFLLAALNNNLMYSALELRTYALYYLMAAVAVLLQQRLIERRGAFDIVALGLVYAALTLSHTFGIIYVGCIALAGWLSQSDNRWRDGKATLLAIIPALLVLACWLPFFIRQSEVGKPYLWFGRPGLPDLLQTIFSSSLSMWLGIGELYCLAGAVFLFVRKHGPAALHPFFHNRDWQPHRYVALVAIGISGFTVAAWVESLILIPVVVPRYFTPQVIVSLALHVAFCELIVRLASERFPLRTKRLAIVATVIPTALLCVTLFGRDIVRWQIPCADGNGAYFETDFLRDDLPVITESSHIFMPRSYYGSHPSIYRFALDWDVVLNYPERARGNATDFHVMENLKTWATRTSIMSTEEIVRAYPQFLALEQSSRAWFYNLRKTRDVTAEKLAEVSSPGGDTCTLWKVTSVKARL